MRDILISFFVMICAFTQGQSVKSYSYQETRDPDTSHRQGWDEMKAETDISFVTINQRFSKSNVPVLDSKIVTWNVKAWKGERVHTQVLIWTKQWLAQVRFELSDLKDGNGNSISARFVSANFVRYVLADGLNANGGGCGIDRHHDSSLVADVIDNTKSLDIEPFTVQPVWLSITVPGSVRKGIYKGSVVIKQRKAILKRLPITVEVLAQTLPQPTQWKYHLDLWQNPFAVARVHQVKPWSKEHLEVMRPYMQRLADAGQKVITASIIHDPWNGQTHDIYHTMIRWVKMKDGTWFYDYSVFDQWVSYMMELGIDGSINCYSLIPWNFKFYYFDEQSGEELFIQAKPGTQEYDAHWRSMLSDFARHLRDKNWFNRTAIAMDERPLEDMKKAMALIQRVDRNFKISLAGNFHAELGNLLFDYSVAFNQTFDQPQLNQRKKDGLITTYYTCCTEGHPNTFTFSPPAEAVWLAWYAANKNYDGYLRWAYNCWPADALTDSRFSTWSAGDAFLIYPGNRSSIRFERLIEGIQDFEKIRLLKEKFVRENRTDQLARLNEVLSVFEISALATASADQMVDQAKSALHVLLGDE